jgi:hypothetical protein
VPGKKDGSGIGDRWHGGKGSRWELRMPDRNVTDHPNLEQYKKQAKELHRSVTAGTVDTTRASATQDRMHSAPSAWPMHNLF